MPYHSRRSNRNCSAGVAKRLNTNKPFTRKGPFMPLLTYAAYRIGGKGRFMELAKLSDDERILKIVERWNKLSKSDQRYVSIDDLLFDSRVTGIELLTEVSCAALFNGFYEIAMRLAFVQEEQMRLIIKAFDRAEKEDEYEERAKLCRPLHLI